MKCAHCHFELAAGERTCPACGRGVGSQDAHAASRVVEGSIESSELDRLARMTACESAPDDNDIRALVPVAPAHPALTALARLPVLAWRQPILRSALKTGASALALTVALRLAGRMVASRGGRQVARESLLPAVADLLQQGENEQPITRRGRSGEVTETFIYIRRTVRW
jgi:hypothetical protein